MATKTGYFYKLRFYTENYISSTNTTQLNEKSKDAMWADVMALLKKMHNKDSRYTYALDDDDKTVIEIIEVIQDSRYIFARIGKQEDLNYLHWRNESTQDSAIILPPPGTYPEKYTYFIIDFNTNIITYISMQSAPNVKKLKDFFIVSQDNNPLCVSIDSIIDPDVVNSLKRKHNFNKINVTVAIPTDDVLGLDGLGLGRKAFSELENVNRAEITLQITAKRNQSLKSAKTQEENAGITIFNQMQQSGHKIKSAKISAFNELGDKKEFDLVNEMVTYKFLMPDSSLNEEEYLKYVKEKLIEKYSDHRGELLLLAK